MNLTNFTNTVYAHGGDTGEASGNHGGGMMGDFSGGAMAFGSGLMILFWVLVVLVVLALIKYVIGDKKDNSKISDTEVNKKKVFVCAECGFEYEEKEWAVKCQKWCKEKKSCNLDIIKHGKSGVK